MKINMVSRYVLKRLNALAAILDAAVKVLRYMLDHAGDLPAAEYLAIEKAIKVRRIKRERRRC